MAQTRPIDLRKVDKEKLKQAINPQAQLSAASLESQLFIGNPSLKPNYKQAFVYLHKLFENHNNELYQAWNQCQDPQRAGQFLVEQAQHLQPIFGYGMWVTGVVIDKSAQGDNGLHSKILQASSQQGQQFETGLSQLVADIKETLKGCPQSEQMSIENITYTLSLSLIDVAVARAEQAKLIQGYAFMSRDPASSVPYAAAKIVDLIGRCTKEYSTQSWRRLPEKEKKFVDEMFQLCGQDNYKVFFGEVMNETIARMNIVITQYVSNITERTNDEEVKRFIDCNRYMGSGFGMAPDHAIMLIGKLLGMQDFDCADPLDDDTKIESAIVKIKKYLPSDCVELYEADIENIVMGGFYNHHISKRLENLAVKSDNVEVASERASVLYQLMQRFQSYGGSITGLFASEALTPNEKDTRIKGLLGAMESIGLYASQIHQGLGACAPEEAEQYFTPLNQLKRAGYGMILFAEQFVNSAPANLIPFMKSVTNSKTSLEGALGSVVVSAGYNGPMDALKKYDLEGFIGMINAAKDKGDLVDDLKMKVEQILSAEESRSQVDPDSVVRQIEMNNYYQTALKWLEQQ